MPLTFPLFYDLNTFKEQNNFTLYDDSTHKSRTLIELKSVRVENIRDAKLTGNINVILIASP